MSEDYTPWIINMLKNNGLTNPKEIDYIKNKICTACRSKNCIDNFRISVNSKKDKEYRKIYDNGCCGFYDETMQTKNGNTIKFGFNYGH